MILYLYVGYGIGMYAYTNGYITGFHVHAYAHARVSTASGPSCLPQPRAVDPDAELVRLVMRGWTSHRITTWVAKIAIEELTGHPVQVICTTPVSRTYTYQSKQPSCARACKYS